MYCLDHIISISERHLHVYCITGIRGVNVKNSRAGWKSKNFKSRFRTKVSRALVVIFIDEKGFNTRGALVVGIFYIFKNKLGFGCFSNVFRFDNNQKDQLNTGTTIPVWYPVLKE